MESHSGIWFDAYMLLFGFRVNGGFNFYLSNHSYDGDEVIGHRLYILKIFAFSECFLIFFIMYMWLEYTYIVNVWHQTWVGNFNLGGLFFCLRKERHIILIAIFISLAKIEIREN